MTVATDFATMANADREHIATIGGTQGKKGYFTPGRVSALASALRPLDQIKPVLKSRYLVKKWLDRGAFSVLYGESNVGKTFFALDLSLHVAAGQDWHDQRVPSGDKFAGPVIYIASEGGSGIKNRIEAMRRDRPDMMKEIVEKGSFALLESPLDLCGSDDAAHLASGICEAYGDRVALIVVDTLARTMGDGDENTAKDMGQFVRSIDHLRQSTGAHVMVIHHSGKDATKGARGSGSLRAAADTEIELTRNDGVVMAEAKKQRDMPCDATFAYALKSVTLGQDEDGDPITSAVVAPTEPVKRKVKLNGTEKIAMQALSDAMSQHGEKKRGDMFPSNRLCVSLDVWRSFCDRHSLTNGESASAQRTAFGRIKTRLQDKEVVKIVDSQVWLAFESDEKPSHPSHTVTSDDCDAAPDTVTCVTPPYKGVTSVTQGQAGDTSTKSQACDRTMRPNEAVTDPDIQNPEMWQ